RALVGDVVGTEPLLLLAAPLGGGRLDGTLEHLAARHGLDLIAAQRPIEETELVEAPLEADARGFPGDSPGLVAGDRAREVVAPDLDGLLLAVDGDRHTPCLPTAVI